MTRDQAAYVEGVGVAGTRPAGGAAPVPAASNAVEPRQVDARQLFRECRRSTRTLHGSDGPRSLTCDSRLRLPGTEPASLGAPRRRCRRPGNTVGGGVL